MTLQDFVSQYNGQTIGDGECGSLVRQFAIEVQGVTPISYPSAKDYWFNPVPGYSQVSSPQPSDWAIYNAHGTYTDGHMAVYFDGRVFEQNANPDGSPAHLFDRADTYLLGYLRKDTMEKTLYPNEGDLTNTYNTTGWPGHAPNANDIAYWTTGTGNPNWGNDAAVWKALHEESDGYAATHPVGSDAQTKITQIKKIIG